MMASKTRFDISQYAVCLIDVLGQEERLKGWSELPNTADLPDSFRVAVRQTAGTVLAFGERFTQFFDAAANTPSPNWLDRFPAREMEAYRRITECSISRQQFGDTFVFYARIPNSHGVVTVFPLHTLLLCCSMAMLGSLAGHSPVRGAICVGPGMELADHTFYGPALAESHKIEKKQTDYPRIVVSESACAFLEAMEGASGGDAAARVMRGAASVCRTLIVRDLDGHQIVDFMGPAVRAVMEGDNSGRTSVETAYRFVTSELERFRVLRDQKLVGRYERLLAYMRTRLSDWGL